MFKNKNLGFLKIEKVSICFWCFEKYCSIVLVLLFFSKIQKK